MDKVIIFLVSVLLYGINCIEFKDCGSTTGKVNSISVSGCSPTSNRCDFKSGSNVTLSTQFQSETESNTATVKVWGIIGGVPIPFNIQPSDACGNWNIKCPITDNNNYELKITLPILKQYPKISFDVRLALIDAANKKLFCQQFPAQID